MLAAALAAVLAGCGTPPPDLFEVKRTGEDRNANVDVVVNDGGSVTCNGKEHRLDADLLLRARQVLARGQLELHPPAERAPREHALALGQFEQRWGEPGVDAGLAPVGVGAVGMPIDTGIVRTSLPLS